MNIRYLLIIFVSIVILVGLQLVNQSLRITPVTCLGLACPPDERVDTSGLTVALWLGQRLSNQSTPYGTVHALLHWLKRQGVEPRICSFACEECADQCLESSREAQVIIVAVVAIRGQLGGTGVNDVVPWLKRAVPEKRLVLLVLGDEYCAFQMTPLLLHKWKLPVIKSFYRGKDVARTSSLYFIPLGVSPTFSYDKIGALEPVSRRKYAFNHIVALKPSRVRFIVRDMLKNIRRDRIDAVEHYDNFMGKHGMDFSQFQDVLLSSKFTLCPPGHNWETYRLWEAIESGSIPVIVNDTSTSKCGDCLGFLKEAGTVPFMMLNGWDDFPKVLQSQLSNPSALEKSQKELIQWSTSMKSHLYGSVLNMLVSEGKLGKGTPRGSRLEKAPAIAFERIVKKSKSEPLSTKEEIDLVKPKQVKEMKQEANFDDDENQLISKLTART